MTDPRNVQAVHRLIEEGFGRGDAQMVDEVVDEEVIEHQPGIEPRNREGVKRAIRFLHTAFPDLCVTLQHTVSDGDMVWCHFKARGTHLGPFGHVPPTGKSYEIDVIDIARCTAGKIVEHWGVADRFSQLEQLGLLQLRREPVTG